MKTVSVPFTVIDLLVDDAEHRRTLRAAAVQVGSSSEIPLTALEELSTGLGDIALQYLDAARKVWDDHASGRTVGDAVLVRVPLIDMRQVDSKAARSDLVGQCQALERMPETKEIAGILDPKPRWSRLKSLGSLTRSKDRATFVFSTSSPRWPMDLGGPGCPGELRREILLEVSHASWRDRRSRRLVRFAAVAVEVWPDPAPYRSTVG
jgi:hypothetical protein